VSPVKYELGLYMPEDDILHSHRRENLKCQIPLFVPFRLLHTFLISQKAYQSHEITHRGRCRDVGSGAEQDHSHIKLESTVMLLAHQCCLVLGHNVM
jgi:hypothetical protein